MNLLKNQLMNLLQSVGIICSCLFIITSAEGTSTETNAADNVDGDVTMEGIPLSASIDHALLDDKVGNWIRTTPDSVRFNCDFLK